jgi:hypothetical protein
MKHAGLKRIAFIRQTFAAICEISLVLPREVFCK